MCRTNWPAQAEARKRSEECRKGAVAASFENLEKRPQAVGLSAPARRSAGARAWIFMVMSQFENICA